MKLHILHCAIIISLFTTASSSHAFWGSNSGDSKSGLNLSAGFDVNTVSTVNGKATVIPARIEGGESTTMSISTANGDIVVVLGPWWYWEKNALPLKSGDELIVTGSTAQGKDGKRYLFAQKVENINARNSITLRNDAGIPVWSRGGGGAGRPHTGGAAAGSGSGRGAGGHGSGSMRGGRRR